MNALVDLRHWHHARDNWPNAEASRPVRAAGLTWHVQEFGRGPVVLLLHGTGACAHSWREVAPLLAKKFNVIALDLPGHGFNQMPPREMMSIYGMGLAIKALLNVLDKRPLLVAGHSAGAAIAVRMGIEGWIAPSAIVGLNAALLPLPGYTGQFFAPLARMLTRIPLLPRLLARRAFDRAMVATMIANTGSRLDAYGVEIYHRLARRPGHVAAALAMMAEWDLPGLKRDLARLKTPLVLVVGTNDRAIPPADAERVKAILPRTEIIRLEGLGHLAHEEAPELAAQTIERFASRFGVSAKEGMVDA
jgi:magnesium chelatase accessory protein